jgi:predicted peptidase
LISLIQNLLDQESSIVVEKANRFGMSRRQTVKSLVIALCIVTLVYVYVSPENNEWIYSQLPQLVAVNQKHGYITKMFVDEDGTRHPYVVFVPYSMRASDRLPLMIYLNGWGENGNDGIMPLKNGMAQAIWEQRADFPFVVMWPQCDKGDAWTREKSRLPERSR